MLDEKQPAQIAAMFSQIAQRYDRANHLLSFNQDKRWRRCLVQLANPQSGERLLDVATGTADIAIAFAQANSTLAITGLDLSEGMLAIASEKVKQLRLDKQINLIQANALELPFAKNSFDIVTIGFGLRNLPDLSKSISELSRVLKPNGRLLIMEFSIPQRIFWSRLYLFYLRNILPWYGGILSGAREPYEYLKDSIQSFPPRQEIVKIMRAHKLDEVRLYELNGGLATLFLGVRQT
jgi:demethylmenaquinone methyltransferase/2-methoxy-6-polyprenyl-1,4-benzoquinol methylase